jgi:hypothetical protein
MKKLTIFLLLLIPGFGEAKEDDRKHVYVFDTEAPKFYDHPDVCGYVGNKGGEYSDTHANSVVDLMLENLDTERYCLVLIQIFVNRKFHPGIYHRYLAKASIDPKLEGIVLAMSGPDFYFSEYVFLKHVVEKKGKKVIVAAGNNGEKLGEDRCHYYPVCYKATRFKNEDGFIVAQANNVEASNRSDSLGFRSEDGVDKTRNISGSSMAAGRLAGKEFGKK